MLLDIPDDVVAEVEAESRRTGRSVAELLRAAVRVLVGDADDVAAAQEARAEGGEPVAWDRLKEELGL